MRRIYLDHSATTPVDPRVVEAMLPYLTEKFGNASSVHLFGQEARAAVDRARRQLAALGGSRGRHIITSASEHPSVRGPVEALEKSGWEVTRLPVYGDGIVRTQDVR